MSGRLEERIVEVIRERGGAVPYSVVVELALYDPVDGFYAGHGGRAGRRGDFLTSPEVGPLFGAVVARALDRWWADAGRPDPFVVVDAGAGPGTLARAVLAASPEAPLDLVLVERSAPQRAAHPDGVTSTADLPERAHVVLANELLDNLPFDLAERTPDGWHEVLVGEDRTEVPGPPVTDPALPEAAAPGARAPLQRTAADWVRNARATGARVVALDYASTTAALAARPQAEWLRTYRAHGRGADPLDHLGEQDITCELAVDQLPPPDRTTAQADWLRAHGLDELVAEGRRVWTERAHLGDLTAVRARSRITEAEALTDPSGLGAFSVLEWEPARDP